MPAMATCTLPSAALESPIQPLYCTTPLLPQVLKIKKAHTKPPVSLVGQLHWREFFYVVGSGTPNFDKMEGNPLCKKASGSSLLCNASMDHLAIGIQSSSICQVLLCGQERIAPLELTTLPLKNFP